MNKTETKSVSLDESVEKIYDKLIDSAYTIGTKMPLTGKVTQKVFDSLELRERSKKVANVMFNPFHLYGKVKASRNS